MNNNLIYVNGTGFLLKFRHLFNRQDFKRPAPFIIFHLEMIYLILKNTLTSKGTHLYNIININYNIYTFYVNI